MMNAKSTYPAVGIAIVAVVVAVVVAVRRGNKPR